jgi:hypothetical protein
MLGSGTVVPCPEIAFEGIWKVSMGIEEITHVIVTHPNALFDTICLYKRININAQAKEYV